MSSASKIIEPYDLLVIGGGSGGLAAARRAARYGARVGVVEGGKLGGTCVNVGCIPKKHMWLCAETARNISIANTIGFPQAGPSIAGFDWSAFKRQRDGAIGNLNDAFLAHLNEAKIDLHRGWARFTDSDSVEISTTDSEQYTVTAKKFCIAVGGSPIMPDIPGIEHCLNSDGFFALDCQPKKVAIVGAGYIAVELAGIFNSLGSETHLIIRKDGVLRTFDSMVSSKLMAHMEQSGVRFHKQATVTSASSDSDGKNVVITTPHETYTLGGLNTIIFAVGRRANSSGLGLENAKVRVDGKGNIQTNEYEATNDPNIFAIGDVCGKMLLTPVAVAAGRRLSDRLFGPPEYRDDALSYATIPSVVFSHPPIGTVGLTEEEARASLPADTIKVFQTAFTPMADTFVEARHKQPTAFKIVCEGATQKVIGLHMIGPSCDEMLQGFAVAVKMGATKKEFDSCIAIHPTSAEELVTMT